MTKKQAGIVILLAAGFLLLAGTYPRAAGAGEAGSLPNYRSPFVEVAQNVAPSVVQITTARVEVIRQRSPEELERFFEGPIPEEFREFFERRAPRQEHRRREGLGSGVILSKEGYIVTNYHVVHGVDEIQVKLLEDETLYPAEIVGVDQVTDLAVVKIDTDAELTPAKLGDSD